MRTTREFIEYLHRAADDIEMMLEDGEITDELVLEPNTYGLGCPYLASVVRIWQRMTALYRLITPQK